MKDKLKQIWISISKFMQRDIAYKIASLVFAIIIWYFVSITVYPTINRNIYGVKVDIDLTGSYAESLELQPVSIGTESINVNIEGDRAKISSLKAEDLVAYVNVDNVTSAREYKLSVEVKSKDGTDFDVKSIEPSTVTVKFDKIITKSFTVEPDVSSITVASGYFKDQVSVTPSTINITGPQNRIENITNVYATTTVNKEIDSSSEFQTSEITLYNSATNAVISNDNEDLTFDKTDFTIVVPVYIKQTVPLEVEIQNAPSGFDVDAFKKQLVMSETEIEIGAPSENIKDINSFVVGMIDMRYVDIGSEFTFDIILGEGYTNLSGIESVTVTCPSDGLAKKLINLQSSDFTVINAPAQYNIKPINAGYSINFIGPEEQLAELSKLDVVAVLDLMPYSITEGIFSCPVQISVPSHPEIWSMGTFNISLEASLKTVTEETESE